MEKIGNIDFNYSYNGVDIEWLMVKSRAQAKEYYYKNFPYLPDELLDILSEISLKNKVKAEAEYRLNKMKSQNT